MSRCDCGIGEKLPEILNLLNPIQFFLGFGTRFYVRVSRTVIDVVTKLFTAVAPNVFELLGLILLAIVVLVIIFIVLTLMLSKSTALNIRATLTAAPPHLTAVFIPMGSATPVEVLLFVVLFTARLADFDALVHFSFATLQLDDPLLHLLPFEHHSLALLFRLLEFVDFLVKIARQLLDPGLEPVLGFLGPERGKRLLFLHLRLDVDHLLQLFAVLVSLLLEFAALLFILLFLLFQILN